MTTRRQVWNPFQPGFTEDPYRQYAELRARNPVHKTPLGSWGIFLYDHALALLRDSTLTVRQNTTPVMPQRLDHAPEPDTTPIFGSSQLTTLDPPAHTRIRRVVHRALGAFSLDSLTSCVQYLVTEALDRAEMNGPEIDLITDVASPLPFRVITDLLGMPSSETVVIQELAHTLTLGVEPVLASRRASDIRAASEALGMIVRDAIQWKRRHLADDALSALIQAAQPDGELTRDELVDQVLLLYVAGYETTVNLIGNGIHALLQHPEQLSRWRQDATLSTNAIDEILRYDPPVQFSRRVATTDLSVNGETIKGGAEILICLGSANRDLGVWGPDAEMLDIGRPDANLHLTFGSGIHHCLGAGLARLEARFVLSALIHRFPRLHLSGTALRNDRLLLRGFEHLPAAI